MHDRSYINHRHVTMSRSLKPLYTPGTKYVFMFLYDIFLEFFFFVFETFDACFVPPSEPHPSVWNRCPQKTKRKLCRQKQLLGMNVSSTSSTATNASFVFAYERRIYHTAKTIPKAFFACGKTGTIIAHFICFHPMSNNGGELIKQTGCATKLQTQNNLLYWMVRCDQPWQNTYQYIGASARPNFTMWVQPPWEAFRVVS